MSNVKRNIIASLLSLGGKLAEKALGLISTLILARLLMPEDFGLVAIAWIVINLVQALTELGTADYIIQKEKVSEDDLNTSWTLNILMKLIVVVSLNFLAPFVSSYYGEESLSMAIFIISIGMGFACFYNPYLNMYIRERNYSVDFRLKIITKVIGVIVTVIGAFLFKSYLALVFGHLASMSSRMVLTYVLIPYRPKFTLKMIKEQLRFSQWVIFRGMFGVFKTQVDTIFVSTNFGLNSVGGYHVNKYIASMPAMDIMTPLMSPLLASFSEVQGDNDRVKYQLSFSLIVLIGILIPSATFLYFEAAPLSSILLGDKWSDFIGVFALLSLSTIYLPFYNIATAVLYIKKKINWVFYFDVFNVICLLFFLIVSQIDSVLYFVTVKLILDLVLCSSYLVMVLAYTGIRHLVRGSLLFIVSICISFTVGFYLSNFYSTLTNPFLNCLAMGVSISFCWLVFVFVFFKFFLKNTTVGGHILFLEEKYLPKLVFFRNT